MPLGKLLCELPLDREPDRTAPLVRVNARKHSDPKTGRKVPAKPIRFPKSHPVVIETETALRQWNALAERSVVTYEAVPDANGKYPGLSVPGEILIARPYWFRVFTHDPDQCRQVDFTLHGRFYDGAFGVQGLPKQQRGTIRVDGQATCEPDYSRMHPGLAYNLAQVECPADIYPPKGSEADNAKCDAVKTMTLIGLNARKDYKAVAAFNDRLRGDSNEGQTLRDGLDTLGMNAKQLYRHVLDRNPLIADQFGSDAGLRLMYVDGKITFDNVNHFVRQGILVLPIHDSYRAAAQHEAELKAVMAESYRRHANGFSPTIH